MLSWPHPAPLADITNQLDALSSWAWNPPQYPGAQEADYNYLVSKSWSNSFIYWEKEAENQMMKWMAQATQHFGFLDSCFFSCPPGCELMRLVQVLWKRSLEKGWLKAGLRRMLGELELNQILFPFCPNQLLFPFFCFFEQQSIP